MTTAIAIQMFHDGKPVVSVPKLYVEDVGTANQIITAFQMLLKEDSKITFKKEKITILNKYEALEDMMHSVLILKDILNQLYKDAIANAN